MRGYRQFIVLLVLVGLTSCQHIDQPNDSGDDLPEGFVRVVKKLLETPPQPKKTKPKSDQEPELIK